MHTKKYLTFPLKLCVRQWRSNTFLGPGAGIIGSSLMLWDYKQDSKQSNDAGSLGTIVDQQSYKVVQQHRGSTTVVLYDINDSCNRILTVLCVTFHVMYITDVSTTMFLC